MGCEYCAGGKKLYQHTNTTNLWIDKFGKSRTLLVECDPCPPYANCCMKNNPTRSAFIINYCPNCGADMREDTT